MEMFKKVLNFYIDSSVHVALSVFSLTWITLIEFDVSYAKNVLYFVFFATITGYNFVKYFGIAKFHHRSLTSWLKIIQIFSFFCFICMCYFAFQLTFKTLFYIGIFGVITFLYAIPFLPKRFFLDSKHNLRSVSGLKIYLIALIWCGVTVFLPLLENEYSVNDDVVVTAIQRFLLIIVLMLPFEIRDLRYDSLKLSTVPQKIGLKQTKLMGVILLFIIFFLEFFKDKIDVVSISILFIISGIILLFLVFSKIEQGKYYSAFWVEGVPVFWLLLLLMFN